MSGLREIVTAAALAAVAEERDRQFAKWGDQSGHPAGVWLAILTEEIGEAATEAIFMQIGDGRTDAERREALRGELVQAAAVAVAWIEALDDADERETRYVGAAR